MIESLIRETEGVRAAYLRGKTLRKNDADSLIHAADALAEMDMRNLNAGQLKAEGNVKYEQGLCELVCRLLPAGIRPSIYYPQTIKGPFTSVTSSVG